MLRYEWKKVFSKFKNRITVLLLLVILIITSILTINRRERKSFQRYFCRKKTPGRKKQVGRLSYRRGIPGSRQNECKNIEFASSAVARYC